MLLMPENVAKTAQKKKSPEHQKRRQNIKNAAKTPNMSLKRPKNDAITLKMLQFI